MIPEPAFELREIWKKNHALIFLTLLPKQATTRLKNIYIPNGFLGALYTFNLVNDVLAYK